MQPSKLKTAPVARVVPVLGSVRAKVQAASLAQALPSLRAAYSQALARWVGDPVLRLMGLPIVTGCYRSSERQNELHA